MSAYMVDFQTDGILDMFRRKDKNSDVHPDVELLKGQFEEVFERFESRLKELEEGLHRENYLLKLDILNMEKTIKQTNDNLERLRDSVSGDA